MRCPKCHNELTATAKFCSDCGEKVNASRANVQVEFEDRDTQIRKRPDFVLNPSAIPNQVKKKIEKAQENLGGTRRLVTVVFADVAGFTSLCEKLDAEAVTDLMNRYLGRFGEIIYEFEGYIDKYMGDCIMALFGAPVAHENDPELALRAASKILDEIHKLNRMTGYDLGIHIGVNAGLVIAGGVGSGLKFDFTVMGDTVNVAQRLQSIAGKNEIVVGKSVMAATKNLFEFEPIDTKQLKGKTIQVEIFRVNGFKTRDFGTRGVRENQLRLFGRESEIKVLNESIQFLGSKKPKPLFLFGEAGLGKSRLKLEFRAIAQREKLGWIETRGSELKSQVPYFAFRSLLQQLLQSKIGVDEKTQKPCLESLEEFGVDTVSKVFIEELLEINLKPVSLEPDQKRKAIFHVIRNLFEGVGQRRRFICFIDNFNLLDPLSKELWNYLGQNLVYAMMAAGSREDFPRGPGTHIELKKLDAKSSLDLARALLKTEALPERFARTVNEKCQGNPLFIEELTKNLLEAGNLKKSGENWEMLDGPTEAPLPDSIQSLILARIDRLYPADREVLEWAAVMGRQFSDTTLRAVLKGREGLSESIQFLRKREFIFEISVEEDRTEYAFNNVLTRDVAYSSILKKKLKSYHGRIAEVLKLRLEQGKEDPDISLLESLVHHFSQTEASTSTAALYAMKAGSLQLQMGAFESAKISFGRVGVLLKEDNSADTIALKSEALLMIARSQMLTGEMEEASEILKDLIRSTGPKSTRMRSLIILADLARKIGDQKNARAYLDMYFQMPAGDRLPELELDALRGMGNLLRDLGDTSKSVQCFQEALKLSESLPHNPLIETLLNDLGATILRSGDLANARTVLEKAQAIAIAREQKPIQIKILLNLASLELLESRSQQALELYTKAIEESENISNTPDQVIGLHNKAIAVVSLKRFDEAKELFQKCHRLADIVEMTSEKNSSETWLKKLGSS